MVVVVVVERVLSWWFSFFFLFFLWWLGGFGFGDTSNQNENFKLRWRFVVYFCLFLAKV